MHKHEQQALKVKNKSKGRENANTRQHADVLSKRKLKNSVKKLSATLQPVIDPLDNQLGYMG